MLVSEIIAITATAVKSFWLSQILFILHSYLHQTGWVLCTQFRAAITRQFYFKPGTSTRQECLLSSIIQLFGQWASEI